MKSQWWSNKKLKKLQEKRLRSIIKFAYEEVHIFHNKCKEARVRPEDIKTVEELVKVPFTTKDEIQANFPHGVLAKHVDLNKCWHSRTSGSTGRPMTMVYDQKAEDFEKATALRPNLTCGQGLRDKWATITSPAHTGKLRWFQKLGFFRQDFLSLFDTPENQLRILRKLNPDVLDGYASSIFLVARELEKGYNERIHPKLIFPSAEMLTEQMRETIISAFDLNPLDQYGCVEVGRTAWECHEHTGYHMDIESVVMEFVREGEQVSYGERGEIVYTCLYNYAMPMIRYRIGDVGVPSDESCPCGRGLPLMKRLEGRKDAYIKTPSGRIFSPIIWTVLLRPYNLVQFKVIQEKVDKIRIKIIPSKIFNQQTVESIKKDINNVLGEEVRLIVEIVKEIPRDSSGKIRSVISKINIESF